MPHRVVIGPSMPPSHQHRQVISPEAIDFRSFDTSSSAFTLRIANGLPSSFRTISRSWGYIPTQGPHQLAENVRTTTLPR